METAASCLIVTLLVFVMYEQNIRRYSQKPQQTLVVSETLPEPFVFNNQTARAGMVRSSTEGNRVLRGLHMYKKGPTIHKEIFPE